MRPAPSRRPVPATWVGRGPGAAISPVHRRYVAPPAPPRAQTGSPGNRPPLCRRRGAAHQCLHRGDSWPGVAARPAWPAACPVSTPSCSLAHAAGWRRSPATFVAGRRWPRLPCFAAFHMRHGCVVVRIPPVPEPASGISAASIGWQRKPWCEERPGGACCGSQAPGGGATWKSRK